MDTINSTNQSQVPVTTHFLTLDQLADRWQMSRRYLQDLVANGAFPHAIRISNRTRIHLADVERIEASGGILSPAELAELEATG